MAVASPAGRNGSAPVPRTPLATSRNCVLSCDTIIGFENFARGIPISGDGPAYCPEAALLTLPASPCAQPHQLMAGLEIAMNEDTLSARGPLLRMQERIAVPAAPERLLG